MQLRDQQQKRVDLLEREYREKQQKNILDFHHITATIEAQKTEQRNLLLEISQIKKETKESKNRYETFEKKTLFLEKLESKLTVEQALFERRKEFYHAFSAKGNDLARRLAALPVQKKLFQNKENPACSLCEQSLSESQQKKIELSLLVQEKFLTHQLKRLTSVVAQLKKILTEQHAHITILKNDIADSLLINTQKIELAKTIEKQSNLLQEKEAAQKKSIALFEETTKKLHTTAAVKKELDSARKILFTADEQCAKIMHELNACEKKLTENDYDRKKHTDLKNELAEISIQQELESEFLQQISQQEQRKKNIRELCTTIRSTRKELYSKQKNLTKLSSLEKKLHVLQQNEQQYAGSLKEIAQKKEGIAHEKGGLEHECRMLTAQEVAYEKK